MRLFFDITMPPEALPSLLDALVAWQTGRSAVAITGGAEAPELTVDELTALLQTMQQRLLLWQVPSTP